MLRGFVIDSMSAIVKLLSIHADLWVTKRFA
jgi:hypothetical protein